MAATSSSNPAPYVLKRTISTFCIPSLKSLERQHGPARASIPFSASAPLKRTQASSELRRSSDQHLSRAHPPSSSSNSDNDDDNDDEDSDDLFFMRSRAQSASSSATSVSSPMTPSSSTQSSPTRPRTKSSASRRRVFYIAETDEDEDMEEDLCLTMMKKKGASALLPAMPIEAQSASPASASETARKGLFLELEAREEPAVEVLARSGLLDVDVGTESTFAGRSDSRPTASAIPSRALASGESHPLSPSPVYATCAVASSSSSSSSMRRVVSSSSSSTSSATIRPSTPLFGTFLSFSSSSSSDPEERPSKRPRRDKELVTFLSRSSVSRASPSSSFHSIASDISLPSPLDSNATKVYRNIRLAHSSSSSSSSCGMKPTRFSTPWQALTRSKEERAKLAPRACARARFARAGSCASVKKESLSSSAMLSPFAREGESFLPDFDDEEEDCGMEPVDEEDLARYGVFDSDSESEEEDDDEDEDEDSDDDDDDMDALCLAFQSSRSLSLPPSPSCPSSSAPLARRPPGARRAPKHQPYHRTRMAADVRFLTIYSLENATARRNHLPGPVCFASSSSSKSVPLRLAPGPLVPWKSPVRRTRFIEGPSVGGPEVIRKGKERLCELGKWVVLSDRADEDASEGKKRFGKAEWERRRVRVGSALASCVVVAGEESDDEEL